MMGSGTVLALARSHGHHALGLDIDPLAVLISRVWTTAIDAEEVRDKATEVLDRALGVFADISIHEAYPRRADHETRQFIRYWFDDYARRQLTSLSRTIALVRDDAIRDVLWCSFSRLIITKQSGASLAMDLSHSRPHKRFDRAPAKPFRRFLAAVDRVAENCVDRNSRHRGPAPCIRQGDARILQISEGSVDLVLTSPPYLNAIDYMRCSKFSLVWMGHSVEKLRRVRANSVGTEAANGAAEDGDIRKIIADLSLHPRLTPHDEAVLVRYIADMRSAVREVARVLSATAKAVYVVGENTIRGTFVRNSKIVCALAELSGLKLTERTVRTLPANRRYLPPPSARSSDALNARMRREVVLTFTRSAT